MVEDVTLFEFAKVETRYDEQQGDPPLLVGLEFEKGLNVLNRSSRAPKRGHYNDVS